MRTNFMHVRWKDLLVISLVLAPGAGSFAQSVMKDLETGLTARGKSLSCDQVYLSDGEQIIKRNTFFYGETYYVNFDGLEGFNREDGRAFPDMQLLVVGEEGDTMLYYTDMYADYEEGIENDPLDLYAEVTVADPMHSGRHYTLYLIISDKKGEGTFKADLDFIAARDENILVESEKLSYREIYLFLPESGLTITDGKAGFNETIYFLFEGLDGFSVRDGQVEMGLSMLIKDGEGNVILEEPDLFENSSQPYEDVNLQVASSLILTGSEVANPVYYEVRIWDKEHSAWIKASTELLIE